MNIFRVSNLVAQTVTDNVANAQKMRQDLQTNCWHISKCIHIIWL